MNTLVLSARRAAVALACAAALVSVAACGNATGGTDAAGAARPSAAAKGSPGAAPNGLEKLAAKEIYNNSRQANADAGSFREQMTREDAKSDLRISATECAGTVEMSQRGSFEIIRNGKDVWADLDGSLTEWVNSQFGIELSADTWIHGTPSHPLMKGFVSWCHSEQISSPDTAGANLNPTKGKTTTVDGQEVVPVSISGKGETVTWYAAATGKPYYLGQDSTRDDMPDITFSEFGKPVDAQKPSGPVLEAPQE
ncbi:hypothetical protein [Streptomyces chartreusis]|uniref:hypothetical protein n=1 Tax=Streptomyces chartreusis TaxID=1969 RepID=UPI002F90C37E|nr:hypothetical protein OG938_44335 [Streptomyces chartreusis]